MKGAICRPPTEVIERKKQAAKKAVEILADSIKQEKAVKKLLTSPSFFNGCPGRGKTPHLSLSVFPDGVTRANSENPVQEPILRA
jgi:hypothetical protein